MFAPFQAKFNLSSSERRILSAAKQNFPPGAENVYKIGEDL